MSRAEAAGLQTSRRRQAAPRARAPCGQLRELLHRQRRRGHAAARSAHRRGGTGEDPPPVPGPQGRSASRRARSCSAAATSTASPSRFPAGRVRAEAAPIHREEHRPHGIEADFEARHSPRRCGCARQTLPAARRRMRAKRLRLGQDAGRARHGREPRAALRAAIQDVRRWPLRAAGGAAGHRRRWQGQHDPARVLGLQSAGLRGHLVQGAE